MLFKPLSEVTNKKRKKQQETVLSIHKLGMEWKEGEDAISTSNCKWISFPY